MEFRCDAIKYDEEEKVSLCRRCTGFVTYTYAQTSEKEMNKHCQSCQFCIIPQRGVIQDVISTTRECLRTERWVLDGELYRRIIFVPSPFPRRTFHFTLLSVLIVIELTGFKNCFLPFLFFPFLLTFLSDVKRFLLIAKWCYMRGSARTHSSVNSIVSVFFVLKFVQHLIR